MVIMNPAMHHDDLNIPEQRHDYNNEGIVLQPFLHQVSGRAAILSLDKTTVCKPLNYREHKFYKSLPPDIKQFTPRFKGIVNVNVEEAPDGSVALTAYPSKSEDLETTSLQDFHEVGATSNSKQQQQHGRTASSGAAATSNGGGANVVVNSKALSSSYHRIKTSFFSFMDGSSAKCDDEVMTSSSAATTTVEVEQEKPRDCPSPDNNKEDDDDVPHSDHFHGNCYHTTVNPWIFKVQREGLRRYLQSAQRTQKCILLENVASKFRKPCILDLKMGTRIHGDYDDHDKQLRHQMKSAATTTKKLGVRLCGMQVYDSQTDSFHCRDKYFGRTLDRNALRSELRRFFRNDGDGRHTRREIVLTVIERLRAIRDSLNRLGSYRFYSSSLLIIYDGTGASADDVTGVEKPVSVSNDVASCSNSSSATAATVRPPAPSSGGQVDIRMVDFAKSTNRYLDGSMVHEGPDLGYIFGLTNLIKLLSEIAHTIPAKSDDDDDDDDDDEDDDLL